jgi:hypothetical protein
VRKTALLLMIMAFALTVASGIAVAAPLLDQQQTTSDSSVLIDSQGSQFYRQSFTAGISGKLSAVSVYVGCCKDGAVPDGNLFVALYGGGIGAQVAVIPQESVHWTPSGSLNWRTFTLSPAPVVEAGEQYYVRLKSTASQDAGYLWGVTSSDAYSGGDLLHYVDGSGGSSTGNDATFRTYVTPSDGTPPETTITSGPSGTVDHGGVTFEFASSESNSTFKCRVTDSHGIGGWGAALRQIMSAPSVTRPLPSR